MTIKVNEVGKTIYVGTVFDLNAAPFTEIAINFTSPDGTIVFQRTNPLVTAPTVDSPSLENTGVLPANTYMVYITQAGDFTVAGQWTLCATYKDASGKSFSGDHAQFQVEESCI